MIKKNMSNAVLEFTIPTQSNPVLVMTNELDQTIMELIDHEAEERAIMEELYESLSGNEFATNYLHYRNRRLKGDETIRKLKSEIPDDEILQVTVKPAK